MSQTLLTADLSIPQIQADLLLSATHPDANIVAAFNNVGAVWGSFQDKTAIYPRLQFYFTLQECASQLKGALRELADTSENGQTVKLSQLMSNACEQYDKATTKIQELTKIARASRAPAVGDMTTTCTIPYCCRWGVSGFPGR